MKRIWIRNLSGKELTDEKVKDFRQIVLTQFTLIIVCLFGRFHGHAVRP